jgi:hypothetical protein
MKDSRSPDPSTAPVGARHDDSSLFTLDALKKTEDQARQQKKTEDSGLIDLKALAAIAQERPKQQDMSVASVVAPPDLFIIAAPVAPMIAPPITTAASPFEQPRPGRTKLLVGVGAAVAVIAAVAAFGATRGPSATAATATATAAPAPTPVAATVAPVPDEPRVAAVNPGERPPPKEDPKPAVTATATATAATKPVYVAPRGPIAKAPPKEEAPPPPPKEACDLACQMARAVNKKK